MFTLEAIKTTHTRVKTGADFPRYVQDMKALGVTHYDHYLTDGHCTYFGAGDYQLSSSGKWPEMTIATAPAVAKLEEALRIHQAGQTDYLTFCQQAAASGVVKWVVDMLGMTCTYYDLTGSVMLEEKVPGVYQRLNPNAACVRLRVSSARPSSWAREWP